MQEGSQQREQRKRTRPATSAVLPDGTVAEMVYRRDEGETRFVCSRAGRVWEERRVELASGELLVPYSASNNLLSHHVILFASDVESYVSEDALLAQVREFIHRYVDVGEDYEEVAAYYVLFTWIYDAFNELPYLRVRGDYGSGKSRFLLTVGSLCYKPIFASGASTVSPLFRLIDSIQGTLIIDEGDFRASDEKAEVVKILNNGNARGFPVLRSDVTPQKEFNPRAFQVFGPKVVATRADFEDPALASRCLSEEMGARLPRGDIPLNLPEAFPIEALALRNKLLSFRFSNLQRKRDLASFRVAGLEPRVSQILAPLFSTIDSAGARERLKAFAARHGGSLSAERALSIEAELLSVIAALRDEGRALSVKMIADRFRAAHEREYDRTTTPRWIGSLLRKRLALTPVRRGGVFFIAEADYPKLDALFLKYGLGDNRSSGDVVER